MAIRICNLFNSFDGASSITVSTGLGELTTNSPNLHSNNSIGWEKLEGNQFCTGFKNNSAATTTPQYCKCLEFYGFKYDSTSLGAYAPVISPSDLPYWYSTQNAAYTQKVSISRNGCNTYTTKYTASDKVEKWTLIQNKCHVYSLPRTPTKYFELGKEIVDILDLKDIRDAINEELKLRNINYDNMNSTLEQLLQGNNVKGDIFVELIKLLASTCDPSINPGTLNTKSDFTKFKSETFSSTEMIQTSTIAQTLYENYSRAVKDCMCYSDCNSYFVCWCYGNCNYY